MSKWLALAAVAALLAGCAASQGRVVGTDEQAEPDGDSIAASLGYRVPAQQRGAVRQRD